MIQSAMFTTKLRVRPLVGFLQHSDVWEGPCRAGRWESLKPEAEKEWAKKMFPQFVDQLKDVIPQVEILEPLAVPYLESYLSHAPANGPFSCDVLPDSQTGEISQDDGGVQ